MRFRAPAPRAGGGFRAVATVIAVFGIAGAAILATVTPASAHDPVTVTIPAADAVVTEVPESFSVSTTQPMLSLGSGGAFALHVTDAGGGFYGTGCLSIVGNTMSMPATLGEAGAYSMAWQYISSDGHATSGELSFTWAPPPGTEPSPSWPTPPVCGERPPSSTPTPSATAPQVATPESGDQASPQSGWDPVWPVIIAGVALLALGLVVLTAVRRRPRGSGPAT